MQDQRGRVGTVGAWQVGLNSNDESKTLKRKPKEKKKEKRKKEEEKDIVNSERICDFSIS